MPVAHWVSQSQLELSLRAGLSSCWPSLSRPSQGTPQFNHKAQVTGPCLGICKGVPESPCCETPDSHVSLSLGVPSVKRAQPPLPCLLCRNGVRIRGWGRLTDMNLSYNELPHKRPAQPHSVKGAPPRQPRLPGPAVLTSPPPSGRPAVPFPASHISSLSSGRCLQPAAPRPRPACSCMVCELRIIFIDENLMIGSINFEPQLKDISPSSILFF